MTSANNSNANHAHSLLSYFKQNILSIFAHRFAESKSDDDDLLDQSCDLLIHDHVMVFCVL